MDSPTLSATLDVLGYWGDGRFSAIDLRKIFFPKPGAIFSTTDLENFFKQNGYETYLWFSYDEGSEMAKIKKFVNPAKKTPVIVYQGNAPIGDGNVTNSYRVVIGVSDRHKRVVLHDHDRGNNFEISYEDFGKMFSRDARAVLAVWPSKNLKTEIKGPDFGKKYPEKTANMLQIGELLATKGAEFVHYMNSPDWEKGKIKVSLEKVISDSNFEFLPLSIKVWDLCYLAELEYKSGNPDKAISIINEKALPINKDFKNVPDGWTAPTWNRSDYPYHVLALAYLAKGEKDLAIENYKIEKSIKEQEKTPSSASRLEVIEELLQIED